MYAVQRGVPRHVRSSNHRNISNRSVIFLNAKNSQSKVTFLIISFKNISFFFVNIGTVSGKQPTPTHAPLLTEGKQTLTVFNCHAWNMFSTKYKQASERVQYVCLVFVAITILNTANSLLLINNDVKYIAAQMLFRKLKIAA